MNSKPSRESNGGRVVILTVIALIVLFGGGYVAAYAGAGAKVPRGATVAGIDIGGKTHDEAVEAVETGLAERTDLSVTVDGKPAAVNADEAGISVDAPASVTEAGGGRSWSPTRLWDYYTGGDDVEAVVDIDQSKLSATVDQLNKKFGTKALNGSVAFRGGEVKRTASKTGMELDLETAGKSLAEAYVSGDDVDLELVEAQPEVDDDDVQEAMDEFANPAVSAPVTLRFGNTRVKLSPKEYSPALGMTAEDGELVPVLDEKLLNKLVKSKISDPKDQPVDASFEVVNGKPKVVPAKPGVDYEPSDISSAFLGLVGDTGKRTVKVKATVKKADFTTAEAKKLGIKTRVSTFTTNFPYAEYRNINLGRAAELINGTVLEPGETFSLNGIVGERTAENGFTKGFIISNGVYRSEYGGGVSQMATTLFNAMFFAGLEDVEHRPHSFYIDRYPVGREATVVWGALDLKFKNDTEHGVLVESHLQPATSGTQGALTVSMYSTKTWDITTKTGDRYNFTSPGTRTLPVEGCTPNTGYGGFDIDVWRYFHKPGSDAVERTEKFHTTYTPSDTVICKDPEPEPEPKPEPKPKNGDN